MTSDLPESLAESWQPIGTRTAESSVLLASVTAETTLYEPIDRAERLSAISASEIPIRSLFAVTMTVSPSLSDLGISPGSFFSTAAPKAKAQFVDTLESEGVTVEGTRNTLEFEATNGAAGAWFVLDAGFPVESELTASGGDRLDAEAHVAVWPTETSYGMAGGTLPLEDCAPVADGDGTTDADEPRVGLDADPERDRETIADLIRTVDIGTGHDAVE
ncbi:hypothetical protein [Natronorubrum halophilum]|uniref:hypothetical protein n=1 Tax=Natronorubrum halophilum TaxID=1702106 RepID=UPI000EF6D842|nr:hypothetical protein [Natronorubrum halophilum]